MWRLLISCLALLAVRCGPTQAIIDVDVTGLDGTVVGMDIRPQLGGVDTTAAVQPIRMNFEHFQIRVAEGQLGMMKIDLNTRDEAGCDVSTASTELNLEYPGNYNITMNLEARPGCTLILRKAGEGPGEVSLSDGTKWTFDRLDPMAMTCPLQNTSYVIEQKQFSPGTEVTLSGSIPEAFRRETYFAGWSGGCSGVSVCKVQIDSHQHVIDVGFLPTVVCSDDRVCWENPRPQGTSLFRVLGRGPNDVWAVGDAGRILRWNGSYWSSPRRPSLSTAINGVWIKDDRNIVTVGNEGVVVRLDDDSWGCTTQQGTTHLRDVYGTDVNNLWAVGEQGTLLHFDGASWTNVAVPSGNMTLRRVLGSGPSDIYAVGEKGTLLHYDGTTWSKIAFPNQETLYDLFMLGTGDAWLVGDKGTSAHIVGTSVTYVPLTTPANLYGVWGSGPVDLWAVGERGAIMRYDGKGWSEVESSTDLNLRSVWGTGVSDVWAVGDNGTIIHYNGTLWLPISAARGTDELNAVWGPGGSSTAIVAVGDRGLGLLWSGADWINAPFNSVTTRNLNGIWGSGGDDIWMVGEAGEIIHANGPSSVRVSSSTTAELFGVWGSAANDVFAVGQGGRLAHYDGMSWTSMTLPQAAGATLRSIYGGAPGPIWIVGDGGLIL